MKALKQEGYTIYLLTTCEKGVFHLDAERMGVHVFSNPLPPQNSFLYYIKQILFLIRFCRNYKIDVVLSNLQHTNFIAVMAQYFISARTIIYRHHFNYHQGSDDAKIKQDINRNEIFFDKVINLLARKIVVPAVSVKENMVRYENANPDKVSVMQYLYDFNDYRKPDPVSVNLLAQKYQAKLILLMCARLIPLKRHHVVFPVIKKLVCEKGYDIKLLVLDEGSERPVLEEYIQTHNLGNHIFMIGYTKDFINYMQISDLMLHPSLTDASNSAVKEMALLGKTSVVCENVGDFSDYFRNNENGFVIPVVQSEEHIQAIVEKVYSNKSILVTMGKQLHNTVVERFSVSGKNVSEYIHTFEK